MDNKIVVITGGNSGIGEATAQLFASQGATVVISARRVTEGEAVVANIKQQGGQALFIPTDVSQAADIQALMDQTIATYGKIDYLFNNAGIPGPVHVAIEQIEEADWDQLMSINLKGMWLAMKYTIPHMLDNGGGSIVNMSSMYGTVGSADVPIYSAAKHGVIGLTKSAALQHAKNNIRINAICPGVVPTALMEGAFEESPELKELVIGHHPIGRLGTVQEIAEAVLWLCSDKSSFIVGHALVADGGFTVV